jgi:hypothetical protein
MRKKLILVASVALSAFALMVIPSLGFAGEFTATCSSGATCSGLIEATGGPFTIQDDSGGAAGRITCFGPFGTATQTSNSTTGAWEISLSGCQEGVFGTQCNNTGTAGQIKVGSLTSHLVKLEPGQTTPVGILLTGINFSFSCPVLGVTRSVTGNIIGEIENPECGKARANHTIRFEQGAAAGSPKWAQVTTSGEFFDLTFGPPSSDTTTATWLTFVHITYSEGKTVTLNC